MDSFKGLTTFSSDKTIVAKDNMDGEILGTINTIVIASQGKLRL